MLKRITALIQHASFFRDLGIVSFIRLSGGLLLFGTQVALARWMTTDGFGVFSFAWMWVAILSTIAGLGYVSAIVRFLARYRDEGRHGEARGLIRRVSQISLFSSVTVSLLAWAGFELLMPDTRYLPGLRIALFAVPVLALLNIDSAFARAMGWMGISAIAEQIARPVILLMIGAVLAYVYNVSASGAFIAACLAAYFVATMAQWLIVRRRMARTIPAAQPRYETQKWNDVAFMLFWLTLAQMLRVNGDGLVVGFVLGTEQIALYVAAVRTATLAAFVLTVTNIVAQPRLSALIAREDIAELRHFYRTVRGVTFLVALAIVVVLIVSGELILGIFGPQYVAAYPALLILLAGHLLAAWFGPAISLLTMGDDQKAVALVGMAGAIANVLFTLLLASRFGIVGAALGSASTAIATAFVMALIAKRRILMSVSSLQGQV
jgi:O-antigen/teichoic acid export membrane protein